MATLYTKQQPPTKSFRPLGGGVDPKRLAPELLPTGNGVINVIKDFPWTLTPKQSNAINETPFILLNEYYVVQSALNQQLLPYGINTVTPQGNRTPQQESIASLIGIADQMFNADTKKLYEGLFDLIAPSDFIYRFPFFTQEHYSANNSWEKKDILDTVINFQKQGFGLLGGFFGGLGNTPLSRRGKTRAFAAVGRQLGKGGEELFNTMQALPDILKQIKLLQLQKQNPAVGLYDAPHVWQGSSPREYGFSFTLYNFEPLNNSTLNVEKLILKNWELCYILTYQNSMNKRNFYTGTPPVFYEVYIPGIHYCKASVMKNITISNIGNMRSLKLPIDDGPPIPVNIPDAYKIDINMQDILMPSKNLLEGIVDGDYQQSLRSP